MLTMIIETNILETQRKISNKQRKVFFLKRVKLHQCSKVRQPVGQLRAQKVQKTPST